MTSIALRLTSACAALLLGACAGAPSAPGTAAIAAQAASSQAQRPLLLLISIDGLRADMLDRGIAPNLSRLAREGVRAQWMSPSYPSLTFPNHYTLVTGLRPDHHGIVHNSMTDPVLGTFRLSDRDAAGDGRWWGGEPIWVGAEKAGLHAATWAWPGSEAAIQGVRPSRRQAFDEHIAPNARVEQALGWLDDSSAPHPQLLTLYFEQVDEAGHEFGPQSAQYARAVEQVDAAIGHLLDGLARRGQLDRTNLIVVSDHGMATVPAQQVVVVEDMVSMQEAEVVSYGQSIGIAPRPGQEARVEAKLLGAHPQYDCWRKAELPPRWHYGSHPRIPPIVCQMHEGWDALPAERAAEKSHTDLRGSHGYDPALPSMRAVFVARGPAFRQGATLAPFDNVDVYPLLARLLGIPAAPNDGDPQTLLPALR
ncbi:alkaline phosphatase family protein [Xanthomonas hyacinthi]|uniref:Alkaline phosphatase family protein n=1 Tax=Xanthomonas hyacinthi TaxID=56455 RepID=A0A2S7EZ02_9XANT|nr:ectonucleotide pyrophosphatase/phosphodiesterase [Xanthomonas hyacinthi]KLD77882.1 phosphodiesterase [Xanthomonas hyacinthi DSM 19077]PPU98378.1 alkaline phosphatase family protein [Xanthomonas hyacinthi]QGY79004.1 alkaline phosphatase family protein [Xanthomonas hyacinthi]